ncbi:hypothetical protein HPP92_023033 [Vanilla planifolia]|uniref:Uncharacterized protein n=1 Tax=Vanilla planifolia TaxID=51239 RepID=A0A835PTD2_VANPL|nr:hypothetical protein HPP92_023344 [Vanilla planifolia]KAG0459905.1 hypothetical protein HPP92_023033 [Vanilla planifolia]
MTEEQKEASNPNPRNAMQAFHFLRALARLRTAASSASLGRRCRAIRRAAYSSMASASGRRRIWSRAVLRRGARRVSPAPCSRRTDGKREPGTTDELRRLVPGGEAMDFCTLLEETADFIDRLSTQVRLMGDIADHLTKRSP